MTQPPPRRSAEASFPPEPGDPKATTLSSLAKGETGGFNLDVRLIEVLNEILGHMKQNNAQQAEQNMLMRKHNVAQKKTNRRLAWVGVGVVLGGAIAIATVIRIYQAVSRVESLAVELRTLKGTMQSAVDLGNKLNDRADEQMQELRDLREKVDEAPGIVVDEKGRPLLEVSITEEQARQLKKPRRRPSHAAQAIEVEKPASSPEKATKKMKPRARLPLDMGF